MPEVLDLRVVANKPYDVPPAVTEGVAGYDLANYDVYDALAGVGTTGLPEAERDGAIELGAAPGHRKNGRHGELAVRVSGIETAEASRPLTSFEQAIWHQLAQEGVTNDPEVGLDGLRNLRRAHEEEFEAASLTALALMDELPPEADVPTLDFLDNVAEWRPEFQQKAGQAFWDDDVIGTQFREAGITQNGDVFKAASGLTAQPFGLMRAAVIQGEALGTRFYAVASGVYAEMQTEALEAVESRAAAQSMSQSDVVVEPPAEPHGPQRTRLVEMRLPARDREDQTQPDVPTIPTVLERLEYDERPSFSKTLDEAKLRLLIAKLGRNRVHGLIEAAGSDMRIDFDRMVENELQDKGRDVAFAVALSSLPPNYAGPSARDRYDLCSTDGPFHQRLVAEILVHVPTRSGPDDTARGPQGFWFRDGHFYMRNNDRTRFSAMEVAGSLGIAEQVYRTMHAEAQQLLRAEPRLAAIARNAPRPGETGYQTSQTEPVTVPITRPAWSMADRPRTAEPVSPRPKERLFSKAWKKIKDRLLLPIEHLDHPGESAPDGVHIARGKQILRNGTLLTVTDIRRKPDGSTFVHLSNADQSLQLTNRLDYLHDELERGAAELRDVA